jgi:peptidoglycan/LPS O-acetylase OafA/YrhL/CubicO group peptidase (beta-lactamase class C family)
MGAGAVQAQVAGQTQEAGAPATGALHYIPGLDGLRALAVLAVLLYHADLPVYGGFLGVESFFVISGFLITALLLADWDAHGRVRLGHFWWRRARRLLPALFALLAGVALLTAALLPGELARLGGEILAALAYVTNWHLIAGGQPYFDAVERPSLLRHLWSLAVEEQFYLAWPLLFAGGMRLLGSRRLGALALLGALVSAALMAALGADEPSRVYYGTDTRAGGLLLGVALAFVWAPGRAPALARPGAGAALDAAGFVALAGLLWAYVALDDGHPLLYRGGVALVAVATAVVVAAATHPAARLLPRLLELPALRWVGVRSYSLYLWHWPIFMVTRPGLDVPADGPALQAARFAAAFALAALSYRWIELPVRNGALERAWAGLRRPGVSAADTLPTRTPQLWLRLWGPMASVAVLGLGVSYVGASIAGAAVRQRRDEARPAPALAAAPQPQAFAHVPQPGRGSSLAVPVPPHFDQAPDLPNRPDADMIVTPGPLAPAADPAAAPAPGSAPAFDPALAARLQELVDATAADGYVPGLALSVRLPDGSTWTGATGTADRRNGLPMTVETRMRIGSLSKLFTAVAALQLVEEGAISLDEPVETWLPGLLPNGGRITVRHLLQHTSGLYDYLEDRRFVGEAYADPGRQWAPEELVAYASRFPARSAPGERWDYSNTNFVVLAMLIERVSGEPLAAQLDRRIFTPLGLEATYVAPAQEIAGPQARGYSRSETHARHSLSFAYGTANIVSTAGDLRRFGEGLFGGKLLRPETLAEMQQFVSGRGQYDMPALEYGLGLMGNVLPVGPGPDGQERPTAAGRVIGHIGGINGFRSALWYAPDADVVIALSMNQGAADPNRLATRVMNALLEYQGR